MASLSLSFVNEPATLHSVTSGISVCSLSPALPASTPSCSCPGPAPDYPPLHGLPPGLRSLFSTPTTYSRAPLLRGARRAPPQPSPLHSGVPHASTWTRRAVPATYGTLWSSLHCGPRRVHNAPQPHPTGGRVKHQRAHPNEADGAAVVHEASGHILPP